MRHVVPLFAIIIMACGDNATTTDEKETFELETAVEIPEFTASDSPEELAVTDVLWGDEISAYPDITNDEVTILDEMSEAEAIDYGPEPIGKQLPVWPCKFDNDCFKAFEKVEPCNIVRCDPDVMTCVLRPLEDGTICDDGNVCTENDKCIQGKCRGQAILCDDLNECTNNMCDPQTGCFFKKLTTPCDDHNPCTSNDYCYLGECVGKANKCICESDEECLLWDDGDPCNGVLRCIAGFCAIAPGSTVKCEGDTACALAVCDKADGQCKLVPVADGKPCEDGNACTIGETCSMGVCGGGTPLSCDDHNPCTADSCDPVVGCLHIPVLASCDDGDACSLHSSCHEGLCYPSDLLACGSSCSPAGRLYCGDTVHGNSGGIGSTNVVQKYSCSPTSKYTGPEIAYVFEAPFDGRFTVELGDKTGDVDVFVLEGGNGCDPMRCVAFGIEKASFVGTAFRPYYVVVDGYAEAEGEFNIRINCILAHETDCNDGKDEDQDGLTDCKDVDDCATAPSCPLSTCNNAWSIECGQSDVWATYLGGSTRHMYAYSCNNINYSGPEYVYAFKTLEPRKVTVRLRGESSNTSLLVLQEVLGACQTNACIDFGLSEVTFDALSNVTYFLVVDGADGAQGKYVIEVECH